MDARRAQERGHLPHQIAPQVVAGDVVQHRQSQDCVEVAQQVVGPIGLCYSAQDEGDSYSCQRFSSLPRQSDEFGAATNAGVGDGAGELSVKCAVQV